LSGTATPGEALIVRTNGIAGGSLVYTPTGLDELAGPYLILDPDGNVVASGSDSHEAAVLRDLPTDGSYYLLLDSDPVSEVLPVDYSLRFKAATPTAPLPLVLGSTVHDVFGEDGSRRYQFEVSRSSLLWLDMLSESTGGFFSLTNAQGHVVANGGLDAANGALLSVLNPGQYTLTLTTGSASSANHDFSFQLSDLAANATAIATDARVDGTLDPGSSTRIYRFNALASDRFKFVSHGASSADVNWRVYRQNGDLVAGGEIGSGSDLVDLDSFGSGQYYLVIDGSAANPSAVSYGFAASLNGVAVDTTYGGTTSYYSPTTYHLHLDQPAWLAFDAFKAASGGYGDYYAYWTLTGADGQIFSGNLFNYGRDPMPMLAAGEYTLRVFSGYAYYSTPYQFRILTKASAEVLGTGTTASGTLSPGNTTKLYRFDAVAGDSYYFRSLQSISGYWRLIDPLGQEVFNTSSSSNQDAVALTRTGIYLLAIEGDNTTTSPQNYSFTVQRPTDKGTVVLNSTNSGSLAGGGVERYHLHLDGAATLVFDNLGTNTNSRWRLDGPGGLIFDQVMATNDRSSYDPVAGTYRNRNDFNGQLAAGDYILTLSNTASAASPYAFRILDQGNATRVVPGTPVSTVVTPANGAQVYTFDAKAGERYYFDALATQSAWSDTNVQHATPQWTLLDPLGRVVFSKADMETASYDYYYDSALGRNRYRDLFSGSDQEPPTLTATGTYTLVLEGYNTETRPQVNVSFNLVKVPNNPPVVLETLVVRPAPDLAINRIVLDPADGLETGQTVNLSWVVENRGLLSTTGGWNDRIVVRNLDTGALVANVTVPYDIATSGNIASGESRTCSVSVRLPEGSLAVGRLSFTVIADADNVLHEGNATGTGEGNNAAAVEATVGLAAYSDLVAGGVTLDPDGNYQPGQTVKVTWTTSNHGTKAVGQPWSERLEVRNLSTNELVASVSLRDDLSDGALAVGGSRLRNAQFVWPTGSASSGRFAIRVVADSASEIPEANASGTGETNNTAEVFRNAGPDLQIRNLRVDTAAIQAGGLITIRWEDWNLGSSATGSGFDDRIMVKNTGANLVLLDTSLPYDPRQIIDGEVVGAIQPGQSRERSFTFRLPYGLKGTGEIGITVTADQNAGGVGVLFETNLANDAELNNSARTTTTAAAVPYADLRIDGFSAPALGVGGEPATVSWTVSNRGQANTVADWNDQVVISTDAVIGNADDVVLGTVRHTGGLAKNDSYTQTASIRVPVRTEGRYYLGVKTDTGAEALEPDTRADNIGSAHAIDLAAAYADLNAISISAPETAQSGENILITWDVRNDGNATTDLALWNDRVVLSTDPAISGDDLILAGSVTHAGLLAPGQSYTGRATITLPRDLSGEYYVIVDTNHNRSVTELGRTGNNARASVAKLRVGLAPMPDLTVADVNGPTALRPGDAATVSYTLSNQGHAATSGVWRDRIYIDRGPSGLYEVASVLSTDVLAAGASLARSATFTLPGWFSEGDFRWVVKTDADNTIYERSGEGNNQASSVTTVHVARVDLVVANVRGPGLVQSGSTVHVDWTVNNRGGATVANWVDTVYLVRGGEQRKLAEIAHAGGLAIGGSYTAGADFEVPIEFDGEYDVLVVSDTNRAVDDANRTDNQAQGQLTVGLSPYADLAVTALDAPQRIIDDPAPLDVSWTVTNQGTGAGRATAWTDRVILSQDDTLGNGDDRIVGEYRHDGALAAGESYRRSERVLLAPGTSARYKLFVVSDTRSEVFENYSKANNVGRLSHAVDVMPIPYADLQVASVTIEGTPASGRPLRLTWEVVNNGIGLTDTADWSDSIWLSRNPDGSGVVTSFASARHIGQLAVGDRYSRSLDITLPDGIEGNYYLNVRTGRPFEFVFGDNNTGSSAAIPVSLSKSPDLAVESVSLPATAQEGALIDVSWTVVNQGEAVASGLWADSVWLVPADGSGSAVLLGSFTYDRGLESGIRYNRTEQVRLPSKIEGLYRVKVVTNANLGGGGNQVYEYGAGRDNNSLTSADTTEVSMNDRADLRVATITVPEHVTAGTSAAIRYTISNRGQPQPAAGGPTRSIFPLTLP